MTRSLTAAYLLIVVAAVVVAACKDDSPAGPGDNAAIVRPTIGSTFTQRSVMLDSTGKEISGTERTSVSTVLDTGRTFMGRTGLYLIEEDSANFYLQYEASGDVSVIPAEADSSYPELWMTLPFGSRRTIAGPSMDTTLSGVRFSRTTTYTYEGTESLTVPAGTFSTQKARRLMRVIVAYMGVADTSTQTIDMWFAPSIGYVVKQRTMMSERPLADSGDLTQLIAYTRK